MNIALIREKICGQGLLPLFYHDNIETVINTAETLYNAGFRVLEFTNRGAAALDNFIKLKEYQKNNLPGLNLGIGTITSQLTAENFTGAGADFIVSPGIVIEVAEVANRHGVPWIPGCLTPTEIIHADRMGAVMIKIFPAVVAGPAFIRAIKNVFPAQYFIATGCGENDLQDLDPWFEAGVDAVGMGSKLITKMMLDQQDFPLLEKRAAEALQWIGALRAGTSKQLV
jgi:2-dehydro-3-deoxyphosphogluconate aldolase/(4S)-4-hydroxy-2-oxoglutarate aldolase